MTTQKHKLIHHETFKNNSIMSQVNVLAVSHSEGSYDVRPSLNFSGVMETLALAFDRRSRHHVDLTTVVKSSFYDDFAII